MKRYFWSKIIIFCFVFLISCGKKDVISETELETAVRNELDEYFDYIGPYSYNVSKSKIKKDVYEAEISIDAIGKYSEFNIGGTIKLIKDESGWVYAGGELSKNNYIIKDYPDEEYLIHQAVNEALESADFATEISSETLEKNNNIITVSFSKEITDDLYSYIRDYEVNYEYEPVREKWILQEENYCFCNHDPVLMNLDGEYIFEYSKSFLESRSAKIYESSNDRFIMDYPGCNEPLVFIFDTSKYGGNYKADVDDTLL